MKRFELGGRRKGWVSRKEGGVGNDEGKER